MKLSNIIMGTRAERRVSLPFVSGETFELAVRPIIGAEESRALAFAAKYAKDRGGEPKRGDALYDLALIAATVHAACVDVDSPPESRELAFASPEEVLDRLDREQLVFLYEHAEMWQDECSPAVSKLTDDEVFAKVMEVVGAEDPGPFLRLRPSIRWSFMRTICFLALDSQELKSHIGARLEPKEKS